MTKGIIKIVVNDNNSKNINESTCINDCMGYCLAFTYYFLCCCFPNRSIKIINI